MTPLKARRMVKTKRSIIYPNDGFWKQLQEYARELGVTEKGTATMTSTNTKAMTGSLIVNGTLSLRNT